MAKITGLATCTFLCVLSALPLTTWAQNYPAKSIRLLLPFAAGGGTDALGRSIAQTLSAQIGQQVVPDNRGGAGGNLALELTAKSLPDGYTMVLSSPLIAISPMLYARLNYSPEKDLAPVTRVGFSRKVLTVHPSVPTRTLKDLVHLARSSPGRLNFGTGGVGTSSHLSVELLKTLTGINIVHVPFKGSALVMSAVAGGEIDMVATTMTGVAPMVQAGRLRAVVVLSETRGAPLTDVPTSAEAGFPGLTDDTWYGMFVPAGTPRDIVNRLNQELRKALGNPELAKRLESAGVEVGTSSPEELGNFVKNETARFGKVIRNAGIKPI